jgi:hypothetical protein
VLLALVLSIAAQAGPPDAPPLVARVQRAIVCGLERLRKAQRADGSWPGAEDVHPGGMSALGAFTLVKSGVRANDPALQKALASVLATEFKSTYSHSVRLLLLEALREPERRRREAAKSLDFLVETQVAGEWAYPWGGADASNTQFALLGLRAAHRMGLDVPNATLENAAKALFRLQDDAGGFRYDPGRASTGGITAATLAGLCVLDELSEGRAGLQSLLRKNSKAHDRSRDWLAEKWSAERNAYGPRAWTPSFHYPYLWAVERYGGLSGQAKLGERDWYAEGALWLVDRQETDGGWNGKLEDTCFALLFLRRATVTGSDLGGDSDAKLDALRLPEPVRPAPGLLRLTDFLAAGPWREREPNDSLLRPPFDPRKLAPKEGDKLEKREWRRVALRAEGWTNVDELLGQDCDHGCFAVATTLAWNGDEPLDALLWLDVEDGWDVYLDGVRVSFSQGVQAPIDNRVAIELTLARGEHRLVVLVEDDIGAAAFGARLSDRAGQPLRSAPDVFAVPPKPRSR